MDRDKVKKLLVALVEALDDHIPMIGVFMDMPQVDEIEAQVVCAVVDSVADMTMDDSILMAVSA